jgi:hypothetical protein
MRRLRFLAYGGTQYSERNRIGAWPKLDPHFRSKSALDDAGHLSFGCGAGDDDAFLIVRQLQETRDRSGVPYTLLLAPSDAHWEKFGWNAALLLQSILDDQEAKAALLGNPEGLGPSQLDAILGSLKLPDVRRRPETQSSPLLDCWMGAAVASSNVTASPQRLGLGDRVEVDDLAGALDGLPPAFRMGYGWLIGGDRGLADALGARLLVDANASRSANESETNAVQLRGRELLGAWNGLPEGSRRESTLAELFALPLWQWKNELQAVERNLLRLVHVQSGDLPLSDVVHELEQLNRAEPLAAEVLSAGRQRLLESPDPFPPLVVDWFLKLALDRGENLAGSEVLRLRQATQERCRIRPIGDDLALHYAAFGDDPGGQWLVDRALTAAGQEIFDRLLNIRGNVAGKRLERVDEWLAAAYATDLFGTLTLDSSLEAGSAHIAVFEKLTAIADALHGIGAASPIMLETEEKSRFKTCLKELLQQAKAGKWTPLETALKNVYTPKELRFFHPRKTTGVPRDSRGVFESIVDEADPSEMRNLISSDDKASFESNLLDEIATLAENDHFATRLAERLSKSMAAIEMLFPFLSETQQDRLIAAIARPGGSFWHVARIAETAYREALGVGRLRSVWRRLSRSAEPPMPPRLRAALLRQLSVDSELRHQVGKEVYGETRANDIDAELKRLVPPSSVIR